MVLNLHVLCKHDSRQVDCWRYEQDYLQRANRTRRGLLHSEWVGSKKIVFRKELLTPPELRFCCLVQPMFAGNLAMTPRQSIHWSNVPKVLWWACMYSVYRAAFKTRTVSTCLQRFFQSGRVGWSDEFGKTLCRPLTCCSLLMMVRASTPLRAVRVWLLYPMCQS